jgi:hypothetical protein
MKTFHTICFLCGILAFASNSNAGTLYAATSTRSPGELYIVDQTTGESVQDIGPLNDALGTNYPMTGLAFSPVTGVLYGSTGNAGTVDALLVRINPATALVTVVGSFNTGQVNIGGSPATMADIAFDSAGNLFGVGSIGGPQLYSINTATGQATVIGSSGLTSTSGGGLAISSTGVFNGTPTATRFGTYNSVTGAYTNIAAPTRPVGGSYAALDYDGNTLYGLNLGNPGTTTHLVTIDPATGAVTDVAASISALDAIAFQVPEPSSILLTPLCLIVSMQFRRRRGKEKGSELLTSSSDPFVTLTK